MIAEFFAFLEDFMIILLILVGMVLLLFGLRQLLLRGFTKDCDDTDITAFRREIGSSDRVLGPHNLFRRFFDMDEDDRDRTPTVPKFYQRGQTSSAYEIRIGKRMGTDNNIKLPVVAERTIKKS